VAFRYELCDRDGTYRGTFVAGTDRWQVGDVFTTGDGHTLRITAISPAQSSSQRPAFTNRWKVEAI